MTERTTAQWRSLLYVPAHMDKFVAKAATRGADGIILDLEDGVPPQAKDEARSKIQGASQSIAHAGVDVLVRINRPLHLAVPDLQAAIGPHVKAIAITKVDGASHLRLLDELVGELETQCGMVPGVTAFVPVVEDLRAYLDMEAIFRASPRNVAALLGSEDFARDGEMLPDPDVLSLPKQQLVICARACGLKPLGLIGSVAGMSDDEQYRAMLEKSRRFGFSGATCIHPGQVASLNEAFSPGQAEIEWARAVVDAFNAGLERGAGAVQLQGRMVDKPVYDRARSVLARAGAYRTN